MAKLRKLVEQLSDADYQKLFDILQSTRAGQLTELLKTYREGDADDKVIAAKLGCTMNAFYVLRSRLLEKIKTSLSGDLSDTGDIYKQLQRIPEICFSTARETATAVLEKLEQDLIRYDMHAELLQVYSALKKIHQSSPRHFHYSQLYNRNTAFFLSLEKCEELLGSFNRQLATYDFSRTPEALVSLHFLASEIDKHHALNPSVQLRIIRNITKLQLTLFTGTRSEEDSFVMLDQLVGDFAGLSDTSPYKIWAPVVDFLMFSHWMNEKQWKRAAVYHDKLAGTLRNLLLYTPVAVTPRFLAMRLELIQYLPELTAAPLSGEILFDTTGMYSSVMVTLHHAYINYVNHGYRVTARLLGKLLDNFSFKDYFHGYLEIRLFQALAYVHAEEPDLAENALKGVGRKIRSDFPEKYKHVLPLIRLILGWNKNTTPGEKQRDAILVFIASNSGPARVSPFLEKQLELMFSTRTIS